TGVYANNTWDTAVTVRNGVPVYQAAIWANIQGGVNAASAGNFVHAYKGTYNELVTVANTLTLEGAKNGIAARTPRTRGDAIVSNGDGDFQIEADNVVIDGFTITGVTNNPSDPPFTGLGAGIWTNPGFSATLGGHQILNNIITGNIIGVYLNNAAGANTTLV